MMDELREQFLIESRDLIADAAGLFGALARNPQVTASIEAAFRAIHTLKGSVALFALGPAERVLHALEDLMERARKGTSVLDTTMIKTLVDCLDQIDRWIDDFEHHGALRNDADAAAERCLAKLASADTVTVWRDQAASLPASGGWIDALRLRHADILAGNDRPLVAFRYQPDADCFFRGDDPLATVRAVPDLVQLAILPVDGAWPDAASLEPYTSFAVLEGLSAAPFDRVGEAFRLMPDQVLFAVIDPDPAPAGQDPVTEDGTSRRTLRVDLSRIDALGDTLGELFVALHGFAGLVNAMQRTDRALAARARAWQAGLERVAVNLQQGLGAVRSVPLEQGLRRLPRLVREISEGLGKPVDFVIEHQDIEVDRQVVEGLFEPLLHLVRNAIDHGLENADQRRNAGKLPRGKLTLAFHRDHDLIVAELTDDGRGMDPDALRQAAFERGLLNPQAMASTSDAAALRLVFLPGFSTARTVSELSGRGMGMDAVQAAVARLRGTIAISSTVGAGTTFRMALPANTLTTRLLVVEAGGDRYGVELDQIVETVGVDQLRLVPVGTGTACVLRGQTVPVLDLAELLGGAADGVVRAPARARPAHPRLIIVRSGAEPVALRVDAFAERLDSLVRPPTGMLALVPGLIGSALMSDGSVLLVLDLPGLAA